MRPRLAVVAAATLPLLAACAPEMDSTIYARDVDEVASTGKTLEIPATLQIPQSGSDGCASNLAELVQNLGKLTPVNGDGKCIEQDGDSFAQVETTISMMPADAATGASAEDVPLFAILVAPGPQNDSNQLTFRMSKTLADVVAAVAPDESSTDFDSAQFAFTVNNDGDGQIALLPSEVYVDGAPTTTQSGFVTIDRRHQVVLGFSNVAADFVTRGGDYWFATVMPVARTPG